MKKLTAILIIAGLLLSSVPISAASTYTAILVNETYENVPTNMSPSGAEVDGEGSIVRVEESNKNKYVFMANQWSDTTVSYPVSSAVKKFWIESRFMLKDNNTKKSLITLFSSSGGVAELAAVNTKNEIIAANGAFLYKAQKDKWMVVSAKVNMTTQRYDVWVNGELVASRIPLAHTFTSVKSVGYTSYANVAERSDFCVDYLRAYTADEMVSADVFPKAEYNENSVKLRNDEIVKPSDEARIMFEQDFEKVSVGELASNLQYFGTSHSTFNEVSNGVGNNFHRFIPGSAPYIDVNIPEKRKQFVIEGSFRVNKKLAGNVVLFMGRDVNATFSHFAYVNADGRIMLHNNRIVGKENMKKDWVKVSVAVDFSNATYDVYENGILVAESISFQNNSLINSLLMRIGPSGVETDIDNLKIYTGKKYTEFKNEDELSGAENKQPVEVYEIDSKPLSTKLSYFKETPQQESAEPSKYLSNSDDALPIFNNVICMLPDSENLWINNKRYAAEKPLKLIDGAVFAPAVTLAALTGDTAKWNEAERKVSIGNVELAIGGSEIINGENKIALSAPVRIIDGSTYVPLAEYTKYVLKKHYSLSDKGLVVIGNSDFTSVEGSKNKAMAIKMMNYIAFDRPNAETLKKTVLSAGHPRAFASNADFNRAMERIKNNETLKDWSDSVIISADEILKRTISQSSEPGAKISGHVYNDVILSLYWAYKLTGNTEYADKAEAYAINMAEMNHWEADFQFLTTGAVCLATSLVYDLFYDYLSDESKAKIAKGIADNALFPAQEHHYGRGKSNWPQRDTNWNIVCNSGVIVGAIALMDAYPELCSDVLEKALASLEGALHNFAPEGGWFEGLGYWEYTVEDMVMAMAALETACGTTYGMTEVPGLMDTAYFPIYLSGNTYVFGYHDVTPNTVINTPVTMWFANKKQDMNLQRYRMDKVSTYGSKSPLKDLMWYTDKEMPQQITLALDANYTSAEVVSMRSEWSASSVIAGIHAGGNSVAHSQLDIGDFDYEVWGTKFADELGKDDYSLPGYFEIGKQRETYYVNRAEGQNVYVINPSESGGQITGAVSEIKSVVQKPKGAIYTVDMAPAYANDVKSAVRGFMLSNDRKVFTVQDEIVPQRMDDEYFWYWHTKCEIKVNEEEKSVTLKDGWKTVKLYFDCNVDFEITAGKAVPYLTSPNPAGQLKGLNYTSMNKITVRFLSESEKVTLRATAVPYDVNYVPGEVKAISEWEIPDGEIEKNYVYADNILVDGNPIKGFYFATLRYDIFRDGSIGVPEITVDTKGEATVEKYEGDSSTYFVKIKDKENPNAVVTYIIRFRSEAYSGLPQGTKFAPAEITASGSDYNLPVNTNDGKLDTRWSAEGSQWIQFDLGEVKNINALSMAVHMGHERKQFFKLEISEDGVNYIEVLDSETTGTTTDYEHFRFTPVNARYVRISGYGNSTNAWNSITEIGVYGE